MKMVKRISIKWKHWIIGMICLLIPYVCYAQSQFEKVYIDEVQKGEEILINKEDSYPLYHVKGQIYIPLSVLKNVGFRIRQQGNITYIDVDEATNENQGEHIELSGKVYMAKYPVYCGSIRSYALEVQDDLLIPFYALEALCSIKCSDNSYWFEENFLDAHKLLKMDEQGIENQTDHIMKLSCIHLYWNGEACEQSHETFILEAGERRAWQLVAEPLYITTWVTQVNEWVIPEADKNTYGQCAEDIFKQYSESIYLGQLTKVFPEYCIEAQMLYPVGTLKEKEIVEVCRSEKRHYFWIKTKKGDKLQVPYGSIRIIGEKGARLTKVTPKEIEDFATLSHIGSPTGYLLWTDIYRQRTYVLKKEGNVWKLEQSFVCSTGKLNNPTPTGFYEVQYSIPYIGVEKGYRCKYALVFFRDYMYHSILFDRSGKYIKSGQYELGSKASHGCIRLSEKDSAWLYEHIPVKTTVWVR